MRHSIIIYSILIFCLGFIPGTPGTFNATDYGQEWQSVDSLESIGLYRQALKKVDEIYEKSKRGHQSGDELKALIFKLRFIHVLSEDGYQEIIRELSKDLEDDRVVIKSIKTSMLAELYLRYYQNNRWSIFKNKGFTDQGSENLETWSPSQFGKIIDSLYQESINSPDLLAGISLSEYQKVLQDSLRGGGNPTVLDLLSNRALDFYQQDELDYSVDPLPQFLMDSMVFSPKDEFLLWLRRQTIGDSFFSKSLAIHSIIINHHLEDIAEGDLLNSDLKRLTNSYRT